jgi:cation diffusion facilitator family transporter
MAEACFYCHKPTGDLPPIPVCEDCRTIQSQATHAAMTDLVPSSSIEELFAAIAKETRDESRCSRRHVRSYYHSMNEWLSVMEELNEDPDFDSPSADCHEATFCVRCATYCAFGLNFMFLCGKALAMSTSASYSILSSLTDSCLDLISGVIIACTAAHSKYTADDYAKYPVGKSRISPVGILVFSILMGCCAIYIILTCINSLVSRELAPPTTSTAVFVMVTTIIVKFCMWLIYAWIGHPITMTLAEDDRNDVFTNALGLFMYWGGARLRWWMDSMGGILLSVFVLVSWGCNALENARMLMGMAAPPDVIRKLTFVAAHHHPLIKAVEKVTAYQLGPMYFAEVYIILRDGISLEAARWVGDSLATRIAKMEDIEQAFVHLDTGSHDKALERILEQGARNGIKYSRDQRGKIVFELCPESETET